LFDVADLRERHDGPVTAERPQEEIQRPDAAVAGGRLERLAADPDRRRSGAGRDVAGHGGGRPEHVVVLVVRPAPVAVLGVDPEVLDRLGLELGPYPWQHLLDQRRIEPEVGQPVLVQGIERGRAPLCGQPRDDGVGGHVTGVHGLPLRPLPRIPGQPEGIARREPPVQLRVDTLVQGHSAIPIVKAAPVQGPAASLRVAAGTGLLTRSTHRPAA
jgi:hypothetical protein